MTGYIFRKENIPVSIAHKSYTLRQALFHTSTERKCTETNAQSLTPDCVDEEMQCTSSDTCSNCDQQYIGSPTRFIHDRVIEHTNNENSSAVNKHIFSCQNKDYKGIDAKISMSENDPANLRLYKAFYTTKYKPTLN